MDEMNSTDALKKTSSQQQEQHCHETQQEIRRQRGRSGTSGKRTMETQTQQIVSGVRSLLQFYTPPGLKERGDY